jgi:hypothetical protein
MKNDENRHKHDIAAAWIAYGLFLLLVIAVSAAVPEADRGVSHAETTMRDAPQAAATDERAAREAIWHVDPRRRVD